MIVCLWTDMNFLENGSERLNEIPKDFREYQKKKKFFCFSSKIKKQSAKNNDSTVKINFWNIGKINRMMNTRDQIRKFWINIIKEFIERFSDNLIHHWVVTFTTATTIIIRQKKTEMFFTHDVRVISNAEKTEM